ncbi:hypothetical protein M1446_04575 [Candidatus Dependentiae bacterium]|nr:hypothetical protein [Candidatus Dependentiae bacterium]
MKKLMISLFLMSTFNILSMKKHVHFQETASKLQELADVCAKELDNKELSNNMVTNIRKLLADHSHEGISAQLDLSLAVLNEKLHKIDSLSSLPMLEKLKLVDKNGKVYDEVKAFFKNNPQIMATIRRIKV